MVKRNSSNKNNSKRSHSKLLNRAFVQLKGEHLVARFRGCGIVVLVSLKKQSEERGKKVKPGKPVTLEDFRDEENDQALEPTPCISTRRRSKKTPKKGGKKNKNILIFHQNQNQIKKYGFV